MSHSDMKIVISQFVQIEQTDEGSIKHPITLVGGTYPLTFAYDDKHEVKIPFRWNSHSNEIEQLTPAQMREELYTPAFRLNDSFGYFVSSVEVATGTVKLSMEWEVMTGTEFASQQERMFNIDCIFSAKRD